MSKRIVIPPVPKAALQFDEQGNLLVDEDGRPAYATGYAYGPDPGQGSAWGGRMVTRDGRIVGRPPGSGFGTAAPMPYPRSFAHKPPIQRFKMQDSTDVNCGRRIEVDRDTMREEGDVIIRAQGDSQEAHNVQLTLSAILNPNEIPSGIAEQRANFIAIVQWGQGGTHFQAEIDFRTGVQVVFPASFLIVGAFLEESFLDDGGSPNPQVFPRLIANAAFAEGNASNRSFPTRTFPQITIPQGDTVVVPVPPFAFSLFPFVAETPPGITFTQLGGPDVADQDYISVALDAATLNAIMFSGEGFLLAGATRFIAFENTGAAGDRTVTPMFGLNL